MLRRSLLIADAAQFAGEGYSCCEILAGLGLSAAATSCAVLCGSTFFGFRPFIVVLMETTPLRSPPSPASDLAPSAHCHSSPTAAATATVATIAVATTTNTLTVRMLAEALAFVVWDIGTHKLLAYLTRQSGRHVG